MILGDGRDARINIAEQVGELYQGMEESWKGVHQAPQSLVYIKSALQVLFSGVGTSRSLFSLLLFLLYSCVVILLPYWYVLV